MRCVPISAPSTIRKLPAASSGRLTWPRTTILLDTQVLAVGERIATGEAGGAAGAATLTAIAAEVLLA